MIATHSVRRLAIKKMLCLLALVLFMAQIAVLATASAAQYSLLYSFDYTPDGAYPYGGLTAGSDGYLYGATAGGGTGPMGALFKVSTGGVHTTLHQFNLATGANPYSPPIEASDGNFYGVAFGGGTYSAGVLYRMTPAGSLTVVHSFGAFTGDGTNPYGSPVEYQGQLYGTTFIGGAYGYGTIYRVRLDADNKLPWNSVRRDRDDQRQRHAEGHRGETGLREQPCR